jgi:orotidine-5'-phosphate decarboxylase
MLKNPIIVALDVQTASAAASLVSELSGSVGAFKVGLELFNATGPQIFEQLHDVDPSAKIFYDAKFHDIPNTVAGAVRSAMVNDIWMFNVHASGGRAMMGAAVDMAHRSANPPLVIAVTLLTSLDQHDLNDDLGVQRSAKDQVVALAILAKESGCDGVVASSHEIESIKNACGKSYLVVTPGVRPAGAEVGDQKRVMTPGEAVSRGSDYIVVGRPITAAESPVDAVRSILGEIEQTNGNLAVV